MSVAHLPNPDRGNGTFLTGGRYEVAWCGRYAPVGTLTFTDVDGVTCVLCQRRLADDLAPADEPTVAERHRARAVARGRAMGELRDRYRDEFDRIVAEMEGSILAAIVAERIAYYERVGS